MHRIPLVKDGCALLPFDSQAGLCALCGTVLTGRKSRWCDKSCRLAYEYNHIWNLARKVALERDGYACVKCHWRAENFSNPSHYVGLQGALWPRSYLTREFGRGSNWLEVNHIEPRCGRGYNMGCAHHVSGLESLCHRCHVKVTTAQRRARLRRAS